MKGVGGGWMESPDIDWYTWGTNRQESLGRGIWWKCFLQWAHYNPDICLSGVDTLAELPTLFWGPKISILHQKFLFLQKSQVLALEQISNTLYRTKLCHSLEYVWNVITCSLHKYSGQYLGQFSVRNTENPYWLAALPLTSVATDTHLKACSSSPSCSRHPAGLMEGTSEEPRWRFRLRL